MSSAEGESRGFFILSLCQPLKSLLFLLYTTDTLSSLLSLLFGSSLGDHLASLDASFSRVELLILSSDLFLSFTMELFVLLRLLRRNCLLDLQLLERIG